LEDLRLCSDKPKEGIETPGNTLTAATPPPSADESDWHDVEDDSFQDNDSMVNEGDNLLRRMIFAPVSDDNSPSKKQVSEDVQVFMTSRHGKNEPNKSFKRRAVIRLPPYQPNRPDPAKEVKNPHISAADKKRQKEKRRQAEKAKPCCDQSAHRYIVSDNDADKEDNDIDSPVGSATKCSASSSTTQEHHTPPTTPDRPITRSRSKQLADEAAQEQITDDQYQAPPSISPPPVKRKRNQSCSSRPDTPVSPLSLGERTLKRPRSSSGSSPLTSPKSRPRKRARCHKREVEE
jgi:hypothetical protein